MKFTVPASELLNGLRAVQSRASGHKTIPILNHIRFEVKTSRLSLLAHNLESCSEAFLPVEGGDGSCALPGEQITKLVGALPEEIHLTVETDDRSATIKAGRSRYKLPILPAEDFPDILPCDDARIFELSDDDVRQLFLRPLAAMDKAGRCIQISGGLLHVADGKLAAYGTDGIHLVRMSASADASNLPGIIVPYFAMEEIAKIGAGRLRVGSRTIAYETDRRKFVSKLVDAIYPDCNSVVPDLSGSYVEVDRDELLTCVSRLCTISRSDSEIYLTFGDGGIVASIAGEGEGMETLSATGDAGDDVVCISASRLREMLAMPRGEVVQIHLERGRNIMRLLDPFEPTAIFVEWCRLPKADRKAAAA